MEVQQKKRLTGSAVLIILSVVLLPAVLQGDGYNRHKGYGPNGEGAPYNDSVRGMELGINSDKPNKKIVLDLTEGIDSFIESQTEDRAEANTRVNNHRESAAIKSAKPEKSIVVAKAKTSAIDKTKLGKDNPTKNQMGGINNDKQKSPVVSKEKNETKVNQVSSEVNKSKKNTKNQSSIEAVDTNTANMVKKSDDSSVVIIGDEMLANKSQSTQKEQMEGKSLKKLSENSSEGVAKNKKGDLINADKASSEHKKTQSGKNNSAKKKEIQPKQDKKIKLAAIDRKAAGWVVQLGTFADPINALVLRDRVRASGYKAFIQPEVAKRGQLTRVFVGPEANEKNAKLKLEKLSRELKIKGLVRRIK